MSAMAPTLESPASLPTTAKMQSLPKAPALGDVPAPRSDGGKMSGWASGWPLRTREEQRNTFHRRRLGTHLPDPTLHTLRYEYAVSPRLSTEDSDRTTAIAQRPHLPQQPPVTAVSRGKRRTSPKGRRRPTPCGRQGKSGGTRGVLHWARSLGVKGICDTWAGLKSPGGGRASRRPRVPEGYLGLRLTASSTANGRVVASARCRACRVSDARALRARFGLALYPQGDRRAPRRPKVPKG